MSFDAVIMPAAPLSPANSVKNSPAGESAVVTLERPTQAADQKKSFLATLNRVSKQQSCNHKPSPAGKVQTAKTACSNTEPTQPADTGKMVDQVPVQGQALAPVKFPATPESPLACDWPAMDLIHAYLMQMFLADDGSVMIEGPSDSNGDSTLAALNQLMGFIQSQGHPTLAGQVAIEPFDQLQTDNSPEANHLSYLMQLVNRAGVDPLAASPSGPQTDQSFFEFWRSLTATPAESAPLDGQAQAFKTRLDAFINFLVQRYDHPSAASRLAAATVEANDKQTIVKGGNLNAAEDLPGYKNTGAERIPDAQAAEMTPTASFGKDERLPAGAPRDLNVESGLEPRSHKNVEHLPADHSQAVSKSAEPAIGSNIGAHSTAAKPLEDMFNLKPSGLPHDSQMTYKTGRNVLQIDGEAKDSSFFASQENLPEHLTKLEHAGRSTASAQHSLASQTMTQIVQKAILLNNNGQNTVQIDLKPDFLGRIRMHIVTENHQVAVRIVTEFPMVKEMLQSNLNQLKTELLAQGLQVDELEVSVAHDSRADDDPNQKAAEAHRTRVSKSNHLNVDTATEGQNDMQTTAGRSMTETAIDFFA